LTIEFKFHKPANPFAPSQPCEQPFILITHKNNIKSSLLTLIRSHLGRNHSKKESSYPEWAKCLVNPDPDDDPESFTNPQCVMQAMISHQLRGPAYYSFDPTQPFINLLRHTHFVEYPTIEVWEEFQGIIIDAQGVVRQSEDERQPKRRKLNPKAGRLAINGLLGDYGSEEEEEGEEEASNMLAALDNYAESDDEGEVEIDPAVLLDLMRQARDKTAVEEDIVDWGDYDSEQE
jgi:hypothetical protein